MTATISIRDAGRPVYRFKDWDVYVNHCRYAEPDRIALRLVAAPTPHNESQEVFAYEPIATATVNIPDTDLGPDEAAINDYSENEGMLNFLLREGIVKLTGKVVYAGYMPCAVVRVVPPAERETA